MTRMSFSTDSFSPPDDLKRPYARPTFTPFNGVANGTVPPQQQHMMGGPFRDPPIQKYPTPTALDVFGPIDASRQYEFRDSSRDFGSLPMNKSAPSMQNTFHGVSTSHHNQQLNSNANGHHHSHREEEISTIFVVGFPDDMQEREFQNMFTFAKGFEAASLKVPHKDSNVNHSGVNGAHTSAFGATSSFNTIPEPFSAVTPSAVMMDPPAWPLPGQEDNFNQQSAATHANPPRKQIIGFAKFRTRHEALEARDFLQGRKVDVERGAMLKAEMAKKNLHTKRGPGPSGLPLSMVGPGGMVGADTLASLTGLPGGAAGLPSQASGEAMRDRERELGTLGAMGFIGNNGRLRERDGSDRERDQSSAPVSRTRFGTSDSDAEGEPNHQLRMANQAAFDAFHSLPIQPPRPSMFGSRSLMSPTESYSSVSPGQDNSSFPIQVSGNGTIHNGPWGPPLPSTSTTASSRNSSPDADLGNFPNTMSGLTLSHSPPPGQAGSVPPQPTRSLVYSSSSEQLSSLGSLPDSSSSSVGDPRERADDDSDTARNPPTSASMPPIHEDHLPDTPPDFISLSGRMNSSDQNPPINTLYVGNLPTSPPPPGFSMNYLEDSLRNLFSRCEGYRKLCFRQKENGPMCFVEFEDVHHASKALSELYGNQLNGLVKTGIRLSYSKNPLGVRSGSSGFRRDTYHGSGPPWSSTSSINGVENKFSPPPGLLPYAQDRAVDQTIPSQRHVPRRESIAVTSELSSNAPQFSFGSHSTAGASARFFTPPTNGVFLPVGPTKPSSFARSPAIFAPFPPPDVNLTPIPRDPTNMHVLTPSPSIESARAG